jgi:hypothetical protein
VNSYAVWGSLVALLLCVQLVRRPSRLGIRRAVIKWEKARIFQVTAYLGQNVRAVGHDSRRKRGSSVAGCSGGDDEKAK